MYEPEIQNLLQQGPGGIDPNEWDELLEGERLRVLTRSHHLLSLSKDERDAVERLPYWMRYGPDDGLPAELFNQSGVLLPKYRPGGGLHTDFDEWRSRFDLAETAYERAEARWDQLARRFGCPLSALGLFSSMLLAHAVLWPLLPSNSPRGLAGALAVPIAAVILGLQALLVGAIRVVYLRRAASQSAGRMRGEN